MDREPIVSEEDMAAAIAAEEEMMAIDEAIRVGKCLSCEALEREVAALREKNEFLHSREEGWGNRIEALREERDGLLAAFAACDEDGSFTPYAELAVELAQVQKDRDEARLTLVEAAKRFVAGDQEGVRLLLCDMTARTAAYELGSELRELRELHKELSGCRWIREDGGENKLAVTMANLERRYRGEGLAQRARRSAGLPVDPPAPAAGEEG